VNSKRIPPIHPCEILLEEFMKPMDISRNAPARDLRVPPRRINEISDGKRRITVDTALRLSRHLGTSVRFWIGLRTLHGHNSIWGVLFMVAVRESGFVPERLLG
jgi:antitoxin HigA-1